jgi:hypothetical protein
MTIKLYKTYNKWLCFGDTYDRWLYDNDFQFWMLCAALRGASEITTIERDALSPIDGKIIYNIDIKNWEWWSKMSNKWYNLEEKSNNMQDNDKKKEMSNV